MINTARRNVLRLAAGATALPFVPLVAGAQSYPSRPVRLVVGFPPGGNSDILARLIGQWLSERLGQSVVIENRPGAGSNIAAEAVARAPADGYTLLNVATVNAINATLYGKLSFNILRDIAPVASIASVANVLVVHPSLPISSVPEFIAYAKAHPGRLNMASAGNGTAGHLSGELFKLMTGVDLVHVPYRGAAPAMTDLIGGQIHCYFSVVSSAIEQIRAGKVRPIAVTTKRREEALPDLPIIADFVPGYESSTWLGIGAPRNTPAEIIGRLNREINAALADARFRERLADIGGSALAGSAADFGALIADETEKWGKVVRFANIRPE